MVIFSSTSGKSVLMSACVAFYKQNLIIGIKLPSTQEISSIQENTMKKNEFRGPLFQSAALLIGTIILATIAASAGSGGSGGGILAIVAGIGNSILLVIGLAIGLGVSIAVLIGIFLAAVAMVSPEQASQMFSDLKKNFFQGVLICSNSWSCCDKKGSEISIDLEEQVRMKQDITRLQETNSELNNQINELQRERILLNEKIANFQVDNSSLNTRIEELSQAVKDLDDSESAIRDLVTDLTAKIQSGSNPEVIVQIQKLEHLQPETRHKFKDLIERVNSLEPCLRQPSVSGIFSYIDIDEHQKLFIAKVAEALKQEMTYAQIDDYLSKVLPSDLDKTIKNHPALTRNYIRNLR